MQLMPLLILGLVEPCFIDGKNLPNKVLSGRRHKKIFETGFKGIYERKFPRRKINEKKFDCVFCAISISNHRNVFIRPRVFTRYLLMIEILIFYISTLMFILSASFENVYLLGIGLILYIFCLWRFVRDE